MSQSSFGPPVIAGLGTAVPEHVISQDEAVEVAQSICCRTEEERSLVRVLYRRSGVKRRHTAVPYKMAFEFAAQPVPGSAAIRAAPLGEPAGLVVRGPTTGQRMELYRAAAPPLAAKAAGKALRNAAADPRTITHLVTVTCTGFFAPGIDVALIEGLGLPATVERLQIGFMGCHGGINGLRAADAIVRARPASRVLLCAVELCSLHFCFEWDPAQIVGNAVFGDGAAALVLEAGPPAARGARSAGASPPAPWRVAATGSCLLPDSADSMTWKIRDHGFEMQLSSAVPNVIGAHLRPWLQAWLASQGLSLESVGSWAVHPGGPRILSAVEEALALPRSATAVSREVLAESGNMSSPTVFFIVERMQAAGHKLPCVALGFGPGLTAEAALFVGESGLETPRSTPNAHGR